MNVPRHASQYPGQGGHYESWFVRANHPERPLALWIRYTQFIADDERPSLGEVWAIWFDGEQDQVIAVKQEFPLDQCHFGSDAMGVELPVASLVSGRLQGEVQHAGHTLAWTLEYNPDSTTPMLLLPESIYDKRLPRAKSITSRPQLRLNGEFAVDGETWPIRQWRGSENHNWGSRHTDQYAWGQVVGFDGEPGVFFECATARVRLGPVYTPWMSLAMLRLAGQAYYFNRPLDALRAKGRYDFFEWDLRSRCGEVSIEARIEAPRRHFAGLTYYNPPAGSKTCLNSKIARCSLRIVRPGQPPLALNSAHGAAFEIFTDSAAHGVPISV